MGQTGAWAVPFLGFPHVTSQVCLCGQLGIKNVRHLSYRKRSLLFSSQRKNYLISTVLTPSLHRLLPLCASPSPWIKFPSSSRSPSSDSVHQSGRGRAGGCLLGHCIAETIRPGSPACKSLGTAIWNIEILQTEVMQRYRLIGGGGGCDRKRKLYVHGSCSQ